MQIYMRVCPICAAENKRKPSHSRFFVPGWENAFISEEVANTNCTIHPNQPYIKVAMTCEEFHDLCYISSEPSFMQAMNDLKEKDIIEYNLKMSQFRTQVEQQKRSESKSDNTPKCPNCSSTNIKKISGMNRAGSIAMFGVFSKKINKSYECKKCGYTW